jgi:dipeptidyl aminopeptidase/acylaminoacyl peptidase
MEDTMTTRIRTSSGQAAPLERTLIAVALATAVTMLAIGAVRVADLARPDPVPSTGPIADPPVTFTPPPPDVSVVQLGSQHVLPLPTALVRLGSTDAFQVSPTGKRVVFEGHDADGDGGRQLFVMRTDGTGRRQLTSGAAPASEPAWSPDGTHVVYVSRADATAHPNLFVVDVRTGRSHQVTHGRVDWTTVAPTPSFSADGRTILFTATGHHGDWVGLWTVAASGDRAQLLLPRAGFGVFSPDGTTIAYHPMGKAVDPLTWSMDVGVWLADADGTDRRPLIDSSGWMMAPISWGPTRPAWSPDGTRIALATLPSDRGPIVVVDANARYGRFVEAIDDRWVPHAEYVGRGWTPTWLDTDSLVVPELSPAMGFRAWPAPGSHDALIVGRRSS